MAEINPPDDNDDYELELEPVDPEILAQAKLRANQRTETAVERIDVDKLYGETSDYSDLTVDWSGLKQFRFTTRHLLILTALLAIVLTLRTLLESLFKTIAVLAVVLLAGGWYWSSRLERRQQLARARRRAEFFGEGDAIDKMADASLAVETYRPLSEFKFAFSMKELFITMTVAVVLVAGFTALGPKVMAITFGAVAVAGLIAHVAGADPPHLVVLGWWLSLVIYFAVGVYQLFWTAA